MVIGCAGATWAGAALLWVAIIVNPASARAADAGSVYLRASPESGFSVRPLFTVGQRIGGYAPPGAPDGTGVWRWDADTVRVFVNHEFGAEKGAPYQLGNGLRLTGARISFFDVGIASRSVRSAGLAFAEVRDRRGDIVTDARQISQRTDRDDSAGFDALCSAAGYAAAAGVFADDVFFVNEESSAAEGHPHGGSIWVLDIREQRLWAAPELGRGSWENVALVATPDGDRPDGHIALLLSDDYQFGGAPLYLWIGRKNPAGDFLDRNGLSAGQLHVWVADDGGLSPQDFNGTGEQRSGEFRPIPTRISARANASGYDPDGYLDDTTLRVRARALGAFMFSRPEDLHANPRYGLDLVWASTGQGRIYPADEWGVVYLIRMAFRPEGGNWGATAALEILHDGDDQPGAGIRNPDNVVWAGDGQVYVQEDKATRWASFGKPTGREASIWRIDPYNPADFARVAEIDRSVRLPQGAVDGRAAQFGAWEASGVLDISQALGVAPTELVLLLSVQAHGVTGGPIGGRTELVEGGQLLLLSRPR